MDYDEGFTLKDGQNGSLVFNKTFPGTNKYKSREIMLEVRPLMVFRACQQQRRWGAAAVAGVQTGQTSLKLGIFYQWMYLFYSREKKKSTWEKILNLWFLSFIHFCQLRYRSNKRAEAERNSFQFLYEASSKARV